MNSQLIKLLQKTDTPTVCNAIELAQKKRGFNHFSKGDVCAMHASNQVVVGYVKTAKIAAQKPPKEPLEIIQKRRMNYYLYMAENTQPTACVIEDTDSKPVGAYWGEVNTTIHKGFGISGVVTNGVMRDIDTCPKDFQVIASGLSVSHGFVHIVDIDCEVEVFGLKVSPQDFIHADRHGMVIIPKDILPSIDKWILKIYELEKIVIEPAKAPGYNFSQFEKSWREFEKVRV